ncbi:MAG: ferredoxin [Elusimicrobia bacterium]|nr:ferredoxin [Elusimicrobiota bacterium]MBU2614280.1 ferredoxin [Elusimicrobiota bacterium]
MKVSVDKDLCTGCNLCVDDCPDVFEMSGDFAIVKVDLMPQNLETKVKEAADNCPVEAIKVS